MASNIHSLRSMGYVVEEAFNQDNDEEPTVYVVDGYGVTTYIREDDQQAIDSMRNNSAHRERKRQFEETNDEE